MLSLILAACGVSPTGGGYERLKAMPEASIAFEGSELLEEGGNDWEMTVDGPLHASYWALYGSFASRVSRADQERDPRLVLGTA